MKTSNSGVLLLSLLLAGAGLGCSRSPAPTPQPATPALAPPQAGQPFENSLGMKFVPVKDTEVLFCIWKTRVKDFEAFANATKHNATAGMYSLRGEVGRHNDTWMSPGFAQTPLHPVCGVCWDDAQAFCAWLTKKESSEGILQPGQHLCPLL